MKKIFLLVFLFINVLAFSQINQKVSVFSNTMTQDQIFAYYYEFEDGVMGQTLSREEAENYYQDVLILIQKYIEPAEKRLFYEARATFFRGMIPLQDYMLQRMRRGKADSELETEKVSLSKEDKETALFYFTEAFELCEESLKVRPNADAYMAKGLLDLFINMQKGRMAAFFSVLRFMDLAKKAAKFDPNNFEAALMLTSTKAIPPTPFGNPKQGLKELEKLLQKVDSKTRKIDLFILYLCFTQVYTNLEEIEISFFWLDKAQNIYPQNESLILLEENMQEEQNNKK